MGELVNLLLLPEPLEELLLFVDYSTFQKLKEIGYFRELLKEPFWETVVVESVGLIKVQKWLSKLGYKYTLEELDNLNWLYLDNNNLTEIPPELGALTNLQGLYLHNNELTEIPPELGALTNLQELYLDNNELTEIPPELGQLTNLRELDLNKNQLASIPPELGQLSNLIWLYLHDNGLTTIPLELGQLSNLEWLDLDNLTLIPPELLNERKFIIERH